MCYGGGTTGKNGKVKAECDFRGVFPGKDRETIWGDFEIFFGKNRETTWVFESGHCKPIGKNRETISEKQIFGKNRETISKKKIGKNRETTWFFESGHCKPIGKNWETISERFFYGKNHFPPTSFPKVARSAKTILLYTYFYIS